MMQIRPITALCIGAFLSLSPVRASPLFSYTPEELKQMRLLLDDAQGIRVPFKLVLIPIPSEQGTLSNDQVMDSQELAELKNVLSPQEFESFKKEKAQSYFWKLASQRELLEQGIDLTASSKDLLDSLQKARNQGKIFQIRMWNMEGVRALNEVLNNVEQDISQFIDSQSKAFGIFTGLFTAGFALRMSQTQYSQIVESTKGADQMIHGALNVLLRHPATSPVILGYVLSTPPWGIAPLIDTIKGATRIGTDPTTMHFPLLAMSTVSGFQIGNQAGQMMASMLLSIPYKDDRKHLAQAHTLLNNMFVPSTNGYVFVADESAIQNFSDLIGKYINFAPQNGGQGILKIGHSVLDMYVERCSKFDASSNVSISRKYEGGRARYTMELIDANYALCSKLWDQTTIEQITLRSKTKTRRFFEIDLFGVKVPSVGAAITPALSAGIGLLQMLGVPIEQINTRINLGKKHGIWDRITGNGGRKNVTLDPSRQGYAIIDMTDELNEDKIRKLVEGNQNEFQIEVRMSRVQSPELRKNAREIYEELGRKQISAMKSRGSETLGEAQETEDLTFRPETFQKLDHKNVRTLRPEMVRPVMIIFNNILSE